MVLGFTYLEIALCLGALFSIWGFGIMGYDKWQATRQGWRVSEGHLTTVMVVGGAFGVKCGQQFFRHKTRKQPLARIINVMLVWNALILGYIVYESFFIRS